MHSETTTETDDTAPRATQPRAGGHDPLALVLAWSREEPWRAGEVLVLRSGAPVVLGRGEPPREDQSAWARFVQQRPGENIPGAPLAGARISRRQLRIEARGDKVAVERIGRCPLLVRGHEVTRCEIGLGDALVLRRELVLYVTRRPPMLRALANLPAPVHPFGAADAFGIVGESPSTWALRDQLAFAAARRNLHVLLLGESGTGKELAARAIHGLSARASRPFGARDASTLPAGIIDAELFGNVRDYPNPGMRERPGLIGEADGSSLFLDEIGELPEDLQAHFLRVLDAGGQYQRLGEARARSSDLRLIGATNRAMDKLKHDLLARLTLRVRLPGLCERREDIPLLARHLLRAETKSDEPLRARFFEGDEPRLSAELVEALLLHDFSHHVRELRRLLWLAIASSPGDRVERTPELEAELHPITDATREGTAPLSPEQVQAVIDRHDGVLERAYRELGLKNRFALHRLIKKYGLVVRRPGERPEH